MDEQMQQLIVLLVQAAMQGDQQAQQQVLQIMQAAQQGDPQAQQIAQVIQAVVQQMQGLQALMARFGAKLNYLKFLRGQCPEGYEMQYMKAGGKAVQTGCKKCQQAQKAAEGDVIAEFKCGRKMKKKAQGGNIDSAKCGRKMKKASTGTELKNPKTKESTQKIGHDVTIRNRDTGPYRREIVEAKGFPNDTNYYYFPPKGQEIKITKEQYLKKTSPQKKANGGTIDIFAPYRNLKLK